jgi:predicted RNA-binding protein associated with RNAse of E/G family
VIPPTVLAKGEPVTVRLCKHGKPDISYAGVVLGDDGVRVVIRAPWALPAHDLGYTTFAPGDMFTEFYWRNRWYAIKEVRDAAGARKGWYCDVTRPVRVGPGELVSIDLYLDLWRSADGRTVLRLDEDEFAASGLPEADPAAAARALTTLDELESAARSGRTDLFGDPPGAGRS